MTSQVSSNVDTLGQVLHDIRNSLSLVCGQSQYLLSTLRPGQQSADGLRIIRRESDRVVALLDRLPELLADRDATAVATRGPSRSDAGEGSHS